MSLTSIAKELPFAAEIAEIYIYSSGNAGDTFEVHFRDADGQLYRLELSEAAISELSLAHRRHRQRS